MAKLDPLYADYKFDYHYPIMGKIWRFKCHHCSRDLRKVPKQEIVRGTLHYGFGEDMHCERHWWCNAKCAKRWYALQKQNDLGEQIKVADLNKRIKGE